MTENFINNIEKYTNIKLWKHQEKLIKMCIEEEEKNNNLALTEKPGAGKTYVIVTLLQYKLLQNPNEKTIIIIDNNIYHQWKKSLEDFPQLKVKDFCDYSSISSLMFYNNDLLNGYNIYLTTPIYYNTLKTILNSNNKIIFNRIIIDEVDNHNSFSNINNINTNKLWYISGTLNKNKYQNFKCIEYNNYGLEIPTMKIEMIKCGNHSLSNLFYDLFKEDDLTILNSLDYDTFLHKMGINEKVKNLEGLIKNYKNNLENELEKYKNSIKDFYDLYEKTKDKDLLEELKDNKIKYDIKKEKYDKMIEKLKEEKLCMICFDNIHPMELVSNLCCVSIFCKKCIYEWSINNDNCPYCRKNVNYFTINKNKMNNQNYEKVFITNDDAIIQDKVEIENSYNDLIQKENQEKDLLLKDAETKWNYLQENKNPEKLERLKEILLNNIGKKIIIFNEYNNVFNKVYHLLKELNIDTYMDLDTGNLKTANECINEFKYSNKKNILLLDGMYNSYGINFENCEIMILMHKTQYEEQIIARAQRPGRTCHLEVYKLHYNKEI